MKPSVYKKRKHRVVVEVTLDRPGTCKDAVLALYHHHENARKALTGGTVFYHHPKLDITAISKPREFPRVFRAERKKAEQVEKDGENYNDYLW